MTGDTRLFIMDAESPDPNMVVRAAGIISSGGILAFPTETVYGLGADATDPGAAGRIYAAKGRPGDNPLIVHISDTDALADVAVGDLARARLLASAFWPGPLTLILPKADIIPPKTTGGLDTVAVRMPRPGATRQIIRASGRPVAAPSANISGRPSPTCAAHVMDDFSGRIEGVVDCGPCSVGIESTIVDISNPARAPVILRRGFILPDEISKVLGCKVAVSDHAGEGTAPRAPGMKYRHYSPDAELVVVTSGSDRIKELVAAHVENKDTSVAVICAEETKGSYIGAAVYCLGERNDGQNIMRNLYRVLRQLDSDGIKVAFSEVFDDNEYGDTIMERLYRASNGRVIS